MIDVYHMEGRVYVEAKGLLFGLVGAKHVWPNAKTGHNSDKRTNWRGEMI